MAPIQSAQGKHASVYIRLFIDLPLLVLPNFPETTDSKTTVLCSWLRTEKDQKVYKHTGNSQLKILFFRRGLYKCGQVQHAGVDVAL